MLKVNSPVSKHWPITSPYGMRVDPITKQDVAMHYGIDFGVPEGTPVVAAVSGMVYKAGWQDEENHEKGFGLRVWQIVTIDGVKYSVFYAHLSKLEIAEGTLVIAGTRIGLSGNTGKSSGPHLHFECRKSEGKGVPIEFL